MQPFNREQPFAAVARDRGFDVGRAYRRLFHLGQFALAQRFPHLANADIQTRFFVQTECMRQRVADECIQSACLSFLVLRGIRRLPRKNGDKSIALNASPGPIFVFAG